MHRLINNNLILSIFTVILCLNQSCVTLQLKDAAGRPRIIGFGSVKAIKIREGKLFSATFPGIGIRFGDQSPGVSLGLHETLSFYPDKLGSNNISRPIAYYSRNYGIDVGPGYVSIGFYRTFMVSLSHHDELLQCIYYSEENPAQTIVVRKDIP